MTAGRAPGAASRRTPGVSAIKLLAAFYFALPFAWMVLTALKAPEEAFRFSWLPENPSLDRFFELFERAPIGTYLLNSVVVTTAVVVGRLAISTLAGYAFARLDFPGRRTAFAFLMISMLLPTLLAIIPLYVAYRTIGWLDTLWPLIVPAIVSNSFGVFWMRQFFLSIPKELEDAARIDGCGPFRTLWSVMLPLAVGNLAALGIFTAISTWNEFFLAVIFISSPENYTLPVGLAFFASGSGRDIPIVMAATLVSILPLLVGYLFAQRRIIDRMIESGLK